MTDDINAKKGSRIEKYGRKSIGNKKRTEGDLGEEKEVEDLNLIKNNHDQGFLRLKPQSTLKSRVTEFNPFRDYRGYSYWPYS